MFIRRMGPVSITLTLFAVGSLAMSILYSYKTGCTADLKTGSIGDTQLALHYSGIDFIFLALSIISETLAIGLYRNVEIPIRAGLATMFFFVGGIGL